MEDKKEILLTQEGYQKLEDELEILKTVRRREVADRIKVAISFGDISENAEYDEAKNEQAQVEERIIKLESMIRRAVIIDESKIDSNVVTIGSIVKVNDMDFEEEVEVFALKADSCKLVCRGRRPRRLYDRKASIIPTKRTKNKR